MCELEALTEAVPIPPAVVTSVTLPSPKLKVTLVMVPSESVPLAVNVRDSGASPVAALSMARLVHTGALSAEGGEDITGVSVSGGVLVGIDVGVGITSIVGEGRGVGMPSVGVGRAPPIAIVAGVDEDKTFSEAWSFDPIDSACVLAPYETSVGVPGGVLLIALKLIVAAFVLVWIDLVGSGPTESVTEILPGEYTGPSRTDGKTVLLGANAFADAVASFSGSY